MNKYEDIANLQGAEASIVSPRAQLVILGVRKVELCLWYGVVISS